MELFLILYIASYSPPWNNSKHFIIKRGTCDIEFVVSDTANNLVAINEKHSGKSFNRTRQIKFNKIADVEYVSSKLTRVHRGVMCCFS